MSKTVDTLFKIMHLINNSDKPLTAEEIANHNSVDVSVRTVQRHAMRLATERLVGFKCIEEKRDYDYTKKSTGKTIKINRNSFGYIYYNLDKGV